MRCYWAVITKQGAMWVSPEPLTVEEWESTTGLTRDEMRPSQWEPGWVE